MLEQGGEQGKKNGGLSRRTFLKSSVVTVAGVVAGTMISGCGKGRKEDQGTSETSKAGDAKGTISEPSFLKAPQLIKDSEISSTLEADVVVVGAGMSGLCAAISAAEEGAKVILLEKTPNVNFRGYDYGAVNSKVQKQVGCDMEPITLTREMMRYAGYRNDQRVVMKYVNESGKVNDWLLEMALSAGCKVKHIWTRDEMVAEGATLPTMPSMTFVLEPTQEAMEKAPKGMIGGKPVIAMAFTLFSTAEKKGVDIHFNTPAVQLIRENENTGRVTAVIAKEQNGKYIKCVGKKGIILCAGDYGNDDEMLHYYIPSSSTVKIKLYPSKANTGDGQKMGMWVGAAIDEPPHAPMYFDIGMAEAPGLADSVMRQPWLSVNDEGDRYANEDLPYAYVSNAVRQEPGYKRWTIWDAKWPEEAPRFHQTACKSLKSEYHDPKRVEQLIKDNVIKSANTFDELAQKMNIPADKLKTSIARYNELAKKGFDEDFYKRTDCMTTIERPPFYAAHLDTALLVTLGGLKINENMQVLDKNKKVIPGLFAAGNNSGSFYANDYCVTVMGNSHGRAYTFGYLAGKNVLKSN
ncbi:FAD-dependent oxidoreductase [Sporomusa acidovorans]|uniref:Fumarate reductase flavoprotein subunit n=1 Tax=Sporomusa acidovorans (strain ATCC 49682 / DSM 3132 / Mol) TaxID=1123286 RepID=A0ABZ3J048_SPOA4|nr:FAD-dependent oxidoreductase [Sporomusa acidovorans]OZC21399.1 fumarate reductase flavoprotein subunit precursor [Sporomusa acidovorans DSM 3132]SDE55220.1 fumarate reductase flavoprotein subunit [Sporomusa acidovorans]